MPTTTSWRSMPASLGWLANQASFEIHAWTGKLPEPWQPTFAYIDIDPGENTTWDETLTLARLYRTALEHLGVRGYPKTTGKRGIQIWIPIVQGKYDFQRHERVGRAGVAGGRARPCPDLISWEWATKARKGRARLDYTQNASIKTLVAPYSVRPAGRRAGERTDHVGRARRSRAASGRLDGHGHCPRVWRRSATCSRRRRPTRRSCRPYEARSGLSRRHGGSGAGRMCGRARGDAIPARHPCLPGRRPATSWRRNSPTTADASIRAVIDGPDMIADEQKSVLIKRMQVLLVRGHRAGPQVRRRRVVCDARVAPASGTWLLERCVSRSGGLHTTAIRSSTIRRGCSSSAATS